MELRWKLKLWAECLNGVEMEVELRDKKMDILEGNK